MPWRSPRLQPWRQKHAIKADMMEKLSTPFTALAKRRQKTIRLCDVMGETSIPDEASGPYARALNFPHGDANADESGRDAGSHSLLNVIATTLLDHCVKAAEKGGERAAWEAFGEAEAIIRECRS